METIIRSYIPNNWVHTHQDLGEYKLVELLESDPMYEYLEQKVRGRFNMGVSKIVRVENPYLWAQYLLKKEEYECKGYVEERELFHDTCNSKIHSIVSTNLDRRLVTRAKYGIGVSFSPYPGYANQESSRSNGVNRALILANVLVQNPQNVTGCLGLPCQGYDTTIGNHGNVIVKFYDDEFYPKYIIYYTSKNNLYFRRRY